MNKKGQKEAKQGNSLGKYLTKNNKADDKSPTPTIQKNEGKKKICTSLNGFLNSKEKPPSPPPLPRKFQLQHYLKEVQMSQLLQKCPKLKYLLQSTAAKASLNKDIVTNILKKYLQSSQQCLWSRRYAPRQISDLFNVQAGTKIKEWISAFFQYKNKIIEEDSFLNDIQSQKSCRAYQNIREHQWQLLALIIRGRPGIGKTSAIRAVAREMDIDLQECGNQYNQTKYLKEKNESTQSESVKTAYTKKAKVQKNAQMITKFMAPVQKEKPKQSKKSQMIHNVSLVFPESQTSKFYQQLSRCVQLSKIPFIMTNSGEKLPKQCEKYDIIEFNTGSSQHIVKILWSIYHIQELCPLDKRVQIQKEQLFEVINSQIGQIEFKQICKMEKVKDICELYNYRLDYIFTFLEHHRKGLTTIDITPMFLDKCKHMNEDQLLEQILFLDFNRFKISSESSLTIQKAQDHNVTQESSDCQKPKEDRLKVMTTYRKMIKLAAVQDTLICGNDFGSFSDQCLDVSEWKDHPYTCIDVKVHRGIKESLAKMANSEINYSSERLRSSLRASELYYLPMLIREKRANRTSRVSVDPLKKIYDPNEFCYLQNFGHFIRQE